MTAAALTVGFGLALVLAVLPDLVMGVVWKLRGPATRPEPLVVTRRYARSAPRETTESEVAWEPSLGQSSAMDSITLDLGDLPDISHWPDEIIDLDDLPDWPPEMAPLR